MKKILTLAVICCMIFCTMSVFATAENIIIDDETVTIPADMGKVCEVDDRTFVPVRFLAEYLGCVVNYQEAQESATITNPQTNTSYFLMANDNKLIVLASVGSSPIIVMDTNVFINDEESRMYVPIRYMAEALGYTVDWDEETLTVVLASE